MDPVGASWKHSMRELLTSEANSLILNRKCNALYSVSLKKGGLRKSLKFTLFLPLLGHFNKFFLLHLNIRYKRITMSCQNLLKVPFGLRYSMFGSGTYFISKR